MSFDLASIAAGAILGAGLTTANRWWQYRRENWYSRITSFCNLTTEAADAASTYWLDEVEISLIVGRDEEALAKSRNRLAKQECRIIGLQTELDGLHASFSPRLSFRDRPRLRTLMEGLGDALTGGDFQGSDRRIDVRRAREAHVWASDLIVEVRHSLDRAIKIGGLLEYAIQRP